MARITRLVSDDEHVHLITREHGVVLLPAFVRAAIGVAALGAGAYLLAGITRLGPVRIVPVLVAGALAFHVMLRLVRVVARWHAQRLVITDRRLLLVTGGLSRRVAILPLRAIDQIEVRRPALGRLLHYGGLAVTVGGRRRLLFGLSRLPDPDLVFGLIMGLDVQIPASGAGRSAVPRTVAVPASVR